MVSVGRPAWPRIVARVSRVFAVTLAVAACTPDNAAICERLAECKLLPEDYSERKCERELERETDLESCRDCVEETGCTEIVEECRDECLID